MTLQLQWHFDEAARIYQQILAQNPNFEECLINLVTIGMARKDHAMISDYSEKLLTLRPNSQTALEGLATCAFASGDYRGRAALLRQAGGVHSGELRPLVQPGRRRAEDRQPEEAAKAYAEAVRIRPDASQAYVNLGVIHQESGDLAKARTAYETRARDLPRISSKCCTTWPRS